MKEKFSLMRKAYNFKQSQWLDPTKSFGHFCYRKSWVQFCRCNWLARSKKRLRAGNLFFDWRSI